MQIVIIEDERFTAEDLENSIKEIRSHFQVVKKLSSVKEAISYFENNNDYNLVFSDIQLGDGLSFDIFRSIRLTAPVIFCTAYDNYAIEAFKANGIDYILKPFGKASIQAAIEKYERLVRPGNSINEDLKKMLLTFNVNSTAKTASSLLVHYKDKIIPIRLEDIALFYTQNEICKLINFDGNHFSINDTLEKIEHIAGNSFFRANRQFLVNRKAVVEVIQHFSRKYILKLSIELKEPVMISKEKSPALLKWLAEH